MNLRDLLFPVPLSRIMENARKREREREREIANVIKSTSKQLRLYFNARMCGNSPSLNNIIDYEHNLTFYFY